MYVTPIFGYDHCLTSHCCNVIASYLVNLQVYKIHNIIIIRI